MWIKRLFDAAAAFVGLLLLLPVLVGIAVWIKLDSEGGILYRGLRAGRYGKLFRICKFRTMVVEAEKLGGPSTADDDPRITKAGKFLRKYKLDELPQLLNILKGEMSLVGPRPEVPLYTALFTEEEQAILSVPPGITDFASLWNPDEGALLAGSEDPEKTYLEQIRPQKIRLQLEYVRTRSFWVDLKIIAATLRTVLRRPIGV